MTLLDIELKLIILTPCKGLFCQNDDIIRHVTTIIMSLGQRTAFFLHQKGSNFTGSLNQWKSHAYGDRISESQLAINGFWQELSPDTVECHHSICPSWMLHPSSLTFHVQEVLYLAHCYSSAMDDLPSMAIELPNSHQQTLFHHLNQWLHTLRVI